MELSIGGQQFIGKGRTRQLAKHEAAAKALNVLYKEPILQELPEVRKGSRNPALKSATKKLDLDLNGFSFFNMLSAPNR